MKKRAKMNKTQLVEKIAERANITKKKADEALKAFESVVTETLGNDETITLVGFGTFEASERKSREGRNPRTGEVVKIDARKVPKFRPGKALKDALK
ncbi:HU family DNA-binding protein [uncultured Ruminobacter sp.]|uniref:HU family DNA-binding protein n=2 Tax=Ruminobacter sp. TaxID=2774296 RepID=UPI00262D7202|nr:HU family DNA-binding protein [uncultured Ruminobacter sp.]